MFVKREDGKIVSYFHRETDQETEFVEDDDPELVSLRNQALKENIISYGVTPLQARKALNASGLREKVEEFIASQSQDVKDAWEYATKIERSDPLINRAMAALQLTKEQVDELFIIASGL